MEQKKLHYYRKKLLEAKTKILNSEILNDYDDIKISSDDLADDADLANSTVNQQVTFSIRSRELKKLSLIDNALQRIEEGSYGFCVESGEEISEKRLENQPWAEFCLEVAEEKEREEGQKAKRA